MTRIIVFETPGTEIREFRTDPKGKPKKVIKAREWKGDPRALRRLAERFVP